VTADRKKFFSMKVLLLVVLTVSLSVGYKHLKNLLCDLFPDYCSYIEISLIFTLLMLIGWFVIKPFAEIFETVNK
jgi:hypothetical protein